MIYFPFIKYLCLPIKDKVFVLWSYLLYGRNIWFTQILGKNNISHRYFPSHIRGKQQYQHTEYSSFINIFSTFVYILDNKWLWRGDERWEGRDEGLGWGEAGAAQTTIVSPTSWGTWHQGDKNATDGQILELSEIYSLHNTSPPVSSISARLEIPETGKQTLIWVANCSN